MSRMEGLMLSSKFRGCLLGSLLGDCLGVPFEGDVKVSKVVLQQYFDTLCGSYFKAPVKQYSDDTAMTKCLAKSLISKKGFDPPDIAQRFVVEYFKDPRRGYGHNVKEVFLKLRTTKFEDPFGPAREQFEGTGSLGNGGAMRVAPVALFYHRNYDELVDKARTSAQITHTNRLGVNGTILQAIAVYQSLLLNSDEQLDVRSFSNGLLEKMALIERDEEGYGLLGLEDVNAYQNQVRHLQRLLDMDGGAPDEEVLNMLGHSVAALYSVPTAIFCFLRAQQNIPEIETDNPFRRTIQYAISLGGDTDTIASMAGAIAGAFYGHRVITESLQKHCEISKDIIKIAKDLYKVSVS